MRLRVSFVTLVLAHYRRRFHELSRQLLASEGIDFDLVYSEPLEGHFPKADTIDLPWGHKVNARKLKIGSRPLYWQSAGRATVGSDLVIIGQENRLLFNYWAHMRRHFGVKTAYFGHGRNFQDRTHNFGAKFKSYWTKRVDWWFAYTEQSKRIVADCGFPQDRITVINNAIDTSEIRRVVREIDDAYLAQLRTKLGITTNKIGIYVGRLYDIKRIKFLLEAVVEIRRRVPDFHLVVIGAGSDSEDVKAAAAAHPWIIYLGARYGRDTVEILRLGRVSLMPGAVGLAVLDCAAAGIPIVTTTYPLHGPEFGYIEHGRTGLIVQDWKNPQAYAEAVASVLCNDSLYETLASGSRNVGEEFTIERMAQRFSSGVVEALRTLR